MKTALSMLLGGTSEQTFLSEVFERRFQFYPGAIDRHDPPAMFQIDSLDTIFSATDLRESQLEVIKGGGGQPAPSLASGEVDRLRCLEMLRAGASLRMRDLQLCSPETMHFARQLSYEISGSVHINAYLTPSSRTALKPHFDDHDVFIVQCLGEKHWVVNEQYERRRDLPNRHSRDPEDDQLRDSDPLSETALTLRQGDVLYMPRGTLHSAAAGAAGSVHLTIGYTPMTWADLMHNAIARAECRDVRFRRAVHPRLCAQPVEEDAGLEENFRQLLRELEFGHSARATRARFSARQAAAVEGLLSDIFQPTQIADTSWTLRGGGCHSLHHDAAGVTVGIVGHGQRLKFSDIEKRFFARLRTLRQFRATDLTDDAGEVQLSIHFLRSLYQLGALVPA